MGFRTHDAFLDETAQNSRRRSPRTPEIVEPADAKPVRFALSWAFEALKTWRANVLRFVPAPVRETGRAARYHEVDCTCRNRAAMVDAAARPDSEVFMPTPRRSRPLVLRLSLLAAVAWNAASPSTRAQEPRPGRVPPPEEVSLTTKDGVQIRITYYPSTAGQQAVPVILLHDYNESRSTMEPLAAMLQSAPPELGEFLPAGSGAVAPRAAVTVDLRGHGESKTAFDNDASYELDANHFQLEDFQDMVLYDLEAVRGFLVAENDAGRLNLNKLCVVGAGMGANLALSFAARDWSIPPLAVRKQGQDVKALVLLSPRRNFHGLSSVEPLKFPPIQQQLSVYLAYGSGDRRVAKDCEGMSKIFDRYHPAPPRDEIPESAEFALYAPNVTLQGSKLLTSAEFRLKPKIAAFVEMRLGRRDFPYTVRKKP
jgi:pimeloyl-ACP methyl ester carboxylesterase